MYRNDCTTGLTVSPARPCFDIPPGDPTPVPIPATLPLLLIGLVALKFFKRKR